MKISDVLSKNNLEKLYLEEKLSDNKIAKLYDLTIGQVHRLRSKYKIRTLEQYERHFKSELDNIEKSTIIGLCLGDGHIRKRKGKKTYPQLMLEQSIIHKSYIYWLRDLLNDWLCNKEKNIKTNRKFNKKRKKFYHSLSFQTICHPAFEEIYNDFYKSGKKVLGRKVLNKYFTLQSLAVWIMDDGSLTGNCKRINISTNNFTKEEVDYLRYFLKERFNLKSWRCRRTNTSEITWEIHFDKKSSILISEMINDLVIKDMKYKLLSETTKGTS